MKIIVLLSSYNGEKFIREQIDSILNQTVSCELIVRDDGSSDNTIRILEQYQQEGKLKWYTGKNIGPSESFFHLIKHADKADYYAFADQDDFWKKDKLEKAIEKLKNVSSPCLYFSKRTIVNQNLELLNVENTKVRATDPGTALIEGVAYGCTMVFDYRVKRMIESFNREHYNYLHDVLIYRLVSLCGTVIYDSQSYILYRQHGSNVIGHELTGWKRWVTRFKHLPKRRKGTSRSDCAKDIYKNFGNQVKNKKYKKLLYSVAYTHEKLSCRLYLFFTSVLHTQHRINVFFLKPFILLGWL